MIHFMLNADCQEIVRFQFEWLTVAIKRTYFNFLCARNQRTLLRNGETAFFDSGFTAFFQ